MDSRMCGFLYKLIPPRPDFAMTMTGEEMEIMANHVGYWTELMSQGSAVALGPVADLNDPHGFAVALAPTLAGVEALRDSDPAVLSNRGFRVEISPIIALVTATAVYQAESSAG